MRPVVGREALVLRDILEQAREQLPAKVRVPCVEHVRQNKARVSRDETGPGVGLEGILEFSELGRICRR